MGLERPGDNVVPIGKAHEIRQQKGVEKGNENKENFLSVLDRHVKKWDVLISKFKEIAHETGLSNEDTVIVHRQIQLSEEEKVRIYFTLRYYRSYEYQLQKIERLLRIFHTIDGETKERVNKSLQDVLLQLEDFSKVFVDYDLPDEVEKVGVLKERITRGFTMSSNYMNGDSSESSPHAEGIDSFAKDVELRDSLVHKMKSENVYDLGLVEQVRAMIEDFTEYKLVFKTLGVLDKFEQYRKMVDDLEGALASYERNDTQSE